MKISIENIRSHEEEELIIRCYEVNDEIIDLMNKLIVGFFDCFLKDYGVFAADKLY